MGAERCSQLQGRCSKWEQHNHSARITGPVWWVTVRLERFKTWSCSLFINCEYLDFSQNVLSALEQQNMSASQYIGLFHFMNMCSSPPTSNWTFPKKHINIHFGLLLRLCPPHWSLQEMLIYGFDWQWWYFNWYNIYVCVCDLSTPYITLRLQTLSWGYTGVQVLICLKKHWI